MAGYTKLFNSILASTIWRENDKTRIVWITMLAMSDRNGLVEGSLPGLADFARVTIAECKAALKVLSSPDEHSRTQDEQGRRIRCVDGGWEIINHAKYREKMGSDERRESNRKAQAAWRERNQKSKRNNHRKTNVTDVIHAEAAPSPEAAPEAKAEAVNPYLVVPSEYVLSGKPDDAHAGPNGKAMPAKTKRIELARPLLHWLNEKAGRHYRETEANLLLIAARLSEVGDDVDGCKQMIDRMCERWKSDPQMQQFLRPETLFGKQKFGGYYDTRDLPVIASNHGQGRPTVADTRNQFIAGANDPTYEAARLEAGRLAKERGCPDAVVPETPEDERPLLPGEGDFAALRAAIGD